MFPVGMAKSPSSGYEGKRIERTTQRRVTTRNGDDCCRRVRTPTPPRSMPRAHRIRGDRVCLRREWLGRKPTVKYDDRTTEILSLQVLAFRRIRSGPRLRHRTRMGSASHRSISRRPSDHLRFANRRRRTPVAQPAGPCARVGQRRRPLPGNSHGYQADGRDHGAETGDDRLPNRRGPQATSPHAHVFERRHWSQARCRGHHPAPRPRTMSIVA